MKSIRFERDESVGRIVLANPPANMIDMHYVPSLSQAVHEASVSEIRVLVIRAEGPHFSFGGDVREWPGHDGNWFRTMVAEVNQCYRAIEALRVPTIAAVRGVCWGGGFELALSCDFIVAAEDATFRCVEVTTGMLPIAGALQRLAELTGRRRASRYSMLGEPIPGTVAGQLGIASHVVPENEVEGHAQALARQLALGPTRSYAATRTVLKAWSAGGVPAADAMLLDLTMDLFDTEDVTNGFINTAEALKREVEPTNIIFKGR
jgi:enoyl-CoA hydratase/carnithine racemase